MLLFSHEISTCNIKNVLSKRNKCLIFIRLSSAKDPTHTNSNVAKQKGHYKEEIVKEIEEKSLNIKIVNVAMRFSNFL